MSSFENIEMGHILVVDDDEAVLAMAKAVLEWNGCSVQLATSGEEAIELFCRLVAGGERVGLILLDLMLPGGITGLETLDRFLALDPSLRIIACSGYFDDAEVGAEGKTTDAARERGFAGILPKPYGVERLTKLVRWELGKVA